MSSPEILRRTDMAEVADQHHGINPGEHSSKSQTVSHPPRERTAPLTRALSFGRSTSPSDRADSPSMRSRTNKVGRALRELVTRSDSTAGSGGSRRGQGPQSGRLISSPLDNGVRWLTPSYRTKNDDMHKLFKHLPPGALVIDDYSCALQRDILAHGRLYLSQQHVCFYANIFGWETVVVVRLIDVTALTREKTAHVIPNALQLTVRHSSAVDPLSQGQRSGGESSVDGDRHRHVQTQLSTPAGDSPEEKYWFTSFVSRDTTYTVLMKVWQNVLLGEPSSATQLRHFACRCWGEKPDVFDAPLDTQPVETSSSDDGSAVTNAETAAGQETPSRHEEHERPSSTMVGSRDDEVLGESMSVERALVAEADEDDEDGLVQCGCLEHEEAYLDQDFDFSVDKLFELLFTCSDFLKNLCRKHKTIDLCTEDWTKIEGDGQRRQVTYTLSLNKTMGPKFSPTTELQHCLERSRAGRFYKVEVEVTNAGIPYGDVYYTLQQYCLTRVSPRQCHLYVGGRIKYRKSCQGLVKTVIKKNCVEGMSAYFVDLAIALGEESLRGSTGSRKRASHRLSSSSLCDRTPTPSIDKLRDIDLTEDVSGRSTPTPPHHSPSEVRRRKGLGGVSRSLSNSSRVIDTGRAKSNALQRILLCLILILVICNAFSLARLYMVMPSPIASPAAEVDASLTHWQELLQLQRRRHQIEVSRWQRSVQSTSKTLIHVMSLLKGFLEEQVAAGTVDKDGDLLYKSIQEKMSRVTAGKATVDDGGGGDGG